MPFNFQKMIPYTVDYMDLKQTLQLSDSFLMSRALQNQFITKWIMRLEEMDSIIVSEMKSGITDVNFLNKIMHEYQLFSIPVFLGKNTLLLHFRIAPLLQLFSTTSINIDNIPLDFFAGDCVCWTPENEIGSMPLSIPIIIVPFPIGSHNFLVIDGNHRLSMHIKSNSKTVPAYTIAGKTLIDNNLFACGFDKNLYSMFLEFQCAKKCFEEGESDEIITSKSLLSSRDNLFHFEEY